MTTATTTRRQRVRKPEGQWKIDGTAPLNHVEEVKQDGEVLDVYDRVVNIYSKQGFDSIPADDIAPRFKWLGLYTQRRQDLGGELTGQVPDAELQDRYFMMRVRFDGGLVTPERLRAVGEISRDYARSTADFTDRQNIQLHWLRIEDIPAIWEKLDTVGLTTAYNIVKMYLKIPSFLAPYNFKGMEKMLKGYIDAGKLGMAAGEGFYRYDK